ncbi:MAG TPA: HAMP domain-containing sensor histidine kinase [Frankiaceae bacterium]|nr:HAMP domain-containing sensor histidine kinase [Frankiaceae bacterium]
MNHWVAVCLVAVVCSAAVAVVGTVALRVLRRQPLARSLLVLVLVPVTVVALGMTVAAVSMFLTSADLYVTLLVVGMSAVLALLAAAALSQPYADAGRRLRESARHLGEPWYTSPGAVPTAELTALAGDLDASHQRLIDSRDRERALEASRRELIAWVSHDLRTPLAGIRAMTEALEDGIVTDTPTVARYHAQIRTEADRLAGMVDDLFELSKVQAGALHLSMTRVTLADIVSDALATVTPIAHAKGIQLNGRAEAGLPLDVDVPEVSRALCNLVVNAIRHTPSDGTIDIVAGGEGRRAYVAVHDACGGIPPGDLDRLFDVGFRGTTARTPGPDGGAGLGLAIARGIVEAHRGEVKVVNEPERGGCRFTVMLPLAA